MVIGGADTDEYRRWSGGIYDQSRRLFLYPLSFSEKVECPLKTMSGTNSVLKP